MAQTKRSAPVRRPAAKKPAPAPKVAGLDDAVPRLLLTVEEAAYALNIKKRKMEELIARGPEHGGVFSRKIGGLRRVPIWALEAYTRADAGRTVA